MILQSTSVESYQYALETLSKRQLEVLECIRDNGPLTNRAISKITGKEINTITPRVKELRAKILVCEFDKVVDTTGRKAIRWKAVYAKELF